MKPIKSKMPAVVISSHSWDRWRERAGDREPKKPTGLSKLVSALLFNALGRGVKTIIYKGEPAVILDMKTGIMAVIVINPAMGWVCKTFLEDEMEIYEDKEAG